MKTYSMNRMRGNQILFYHYFIVKVLQELDYYDDLVVFLYGEKDQLNEITKKNL